MRPLIWLTICSSLAQARPCGERKGGALIRVEIDKETWSFWSTNPAFIDRAKQLQASGGYHVADFERLVDGTDCDAQWSWHSAPALMSWPSKTIEVCVGKPSDIEHDKRYWINSVTRYCPWSLKVLAV